MAGKPLFQVGPVYHADFFNNYREKDKYHYLIERYCFDGQSLTNWNAIHCEKIKRINYRLIDIKPPFIYNANLEIVKLKSPTLKKCILMEKKTIQRLMFLIFHIPFRRSELNVNKKSNHRRYSWYQGIGKTCLGGHLQMYYST
ncbi:hypothetical protein [Paenibacillus sp. NPDC055715]